MRCRRQRGFTLIEVMIALAVLALALGAVIQAISSNTEHVSYLRDKTIAHWVAMNKVAEMQARLEWPGVGSDTGREEMAGHEWHWKTQVTAFEDQVLQDVRQVQVEVRRNRGDKSPLITIMALLGKPVG